MGLLGFLGRLIGGRQKTSSGAAPIETNPAVPDRRSAAARGKSALPRGRMRETDKVKGPLSPLPKAPGLYQHINKATREVEYVGQTNNLRTRQQQHANSGRLDTEKQFIRFGVAKDTATKCDLCQTEVHHIAKHSPSGNKTKGGNGRQ